MIEQKQALRAWAREMGTKQSYLELIRSDGQILRQILCSDAYRNASTVYAYYSMGREVDTRQLLAHCLRDGKTVGLPVCMADGSMTFRKYTGQLLPGAYGIPIPDGPELPPPERSDLFLVPGLCFDRWGNRLGQGGGYYDRYLEQFPSAQVGVCRRPFYLKEIPHEETDRAMTAVITEDGWMPIRR